MTAPGYIYPTRFLGGYTAPERRGEREWLLTVCRVMSAWAIKSSGGRDER